MTLVPYYRVSYRGRYYEAGQPVDITAEDAEEMKVHGTIFEREQPKESAGETEGAREVATAPEKTARKPGRPKKVQ